jgi:hypothetical protein
MIDLRLPGSFWKIAFQTWFILEISVFENAYFQNEPGMNKRFPENAYFQNEPGLKSDFMKSDFVN